MRLCGLLYVFNNAFRPAPTFGAPAVLPLAGTFITCIVPQLVDYEDLDAAFDAQPSPPSSNHFIVESDEQSLSDDPASEEEGEEEEDSDGEEKPHVNAVASSDADVNSAAGVNGGGVVQMPSPSFGDLLISRRAQQVTAFEVRVLDGAYFEVLSTNGVASALD